MRWSNPVSRVGRRENQSARPTTVPIIAPIAPTTAPFVINTSRRCFWCRAGRGEHAELAEPSLRDDGEAGGDNQRGQEQEDGGDREHGQRALRAGRSSPVRRIPTRRPAGLLTGTKAVD